MTDAALADHFPPGHESEGRRLLPVAIEFAESEDSEFPNADLVSVFELLAEGKGLFNIGLSMGWSPAKIKRFTDNADRRELIFALEERLHEGMEESVYDLGFRRGNVAAQRLWLFCKASHRGWTDTRHVNVGIEARQELIVSVRHALDAKIGELVSGSGAAGIAALQNAMLDGDDEILDADIVD